MTSWEDWLWVGFISVMVLVFGGILVAGIAINTNHDKQEAVLRDWCTPPAKVVEICPEDNGNCEGKYPDLEWKCIVIIEKDSAR